MFSPLTTRAHSRRGKSTLACRNGQFRPTLKKSKARQDRAAPSASAGPYSSVARSFAFLLQKSFEIERLGGARVLTILQRRYQFRHPRFLSKRKLVRTTSLASPKRPEANWRSTMPAESGSSETDGTRDNLLSSPPRR